MMDRGYLETSARMAKVDITPPFGVEITGHPCYLHEPGGGAERLWAKALILEHANKRLVLITVDCIWISEEMRSAVVEEARRHGISAAYVLIGATHSHSGPQTLTDEWAVCGKPNLCYLTTLNDMLTKLVAQAFDNQGTPVNAFYGETRCPGTVKRNKLRWVFQKGLGVFYPARRMIFLPSLSTASDDVVRVLVLKREDGTTAAIIFNYACHPTCITNEGISRDYPGAAEDRIFELTGSESFFVQGFSGDQGPLFLEGWASFARRFLRCTASILNERARRFRYGTRIEMTDFGRRLADAVVNLIASNTMTPLAVGLDANIVSVEVPTRSGKFVPLYVQRLTLGPRLSMVALSAEVYSAFGEILQSILANTRIIPIGLANGIIGYVHPQKIAVCEPYGYGLAIRSAVGMLAHDHEVDVVHGLKKCILGSKDTVSGQEAELRSVYDSEYTECRLAYSEYHPEYINPAFWQQRMSGFDGDRIRGVGAYVGNQWAGGILVYPIPMRGQRGEILRGGKMEALVVLPFARKKSYLFPDGRLERVSVALSRALIEEERMAGLQIVFGCPSVPAWRAHRFAGHAIIDMPSYLMVYFLSARGRAESGLKWKPIEAGVFFLNRFPRQSSPRDSTECIIRSLNSAPNDIAELDEVLAMSHPGIGVVRTAAYLNWRFDAENYLFLEARNSSSKLCGYLVGERIPRAGQLRLIDIVVLPDQPSAAHGLINSYIAFGAALGVRNVNFVNAGLGPLAEFQRKLLGGYGFFSYLLSQSFWIADCANGYKNEDILDASNWNGSGLNFDSP